MPLQSQYKLTGGLRVGLLEKKLLATLTMYQLLFQQF